MEKLKQLRTRRGYSQQELADLADVAQHAISEIELGRRKPHGRTLRKIATALDVNITDLTESETGKALSPQPDPEDAASSEVGEAIDYRKLYFDLGRQRIELLDKVLKNVDEALTTEDYDEFIKLPPDEQHWRIEWAERWNQMAEEILADMANEQAELAGEHLDELAKRRAAIDARLEKFRKAA